MTDKIKEMTDNKIIDDTEFPHSSEDHDVVVNLPDNLNELIRKSTDIDDLSSCSFATQEKYEDSDGEKQAEVISSENENVDFDTSTVILNPADFIDPEIETVIQYELGSDSTIVQNECVNIADNDEEDKKEPESADIEKPGTTQVSHETVQDELHDEVAKVPQLSPKFIIKKQKSINERLKPLLDEQFYDGPRLEKLAKRMKILPQVFDVAKNIASVKRKHPEVYTMKQFDTFNFTYHDELRHRFELNKKKGYNATYNTHLKKEAKRYQTEDAKMISFVRDIYKTCKLLCTQYEDMDFC